MLTESQVERSFRAILKQADGSEEVFEKAEEVLEDLRWESPLRHRLMTELDELRAAAANGK